jgi:hypothetical protein
VGEGGVPMDVQPVVTGIGAADHEIYQHRSNPPGASAERNDSVSPYSLWKALISTLATNWTT